MLAIEVENIKDTLVKILSPVALSLLAGKETEVKENVFITLTGKLSFDIGLKNGGISFQFKITPHVRVHKVLNLHGELTEAIVTKEGISLLIDGLPDVFLEAIS
jgi:hypothetical protein